MPIGDQVDHLPKTTFNIGKNIFKIIINMATHNTQDINQNWRTKSQGK